MYIARTAQKLREQMVRFSGELSAGLPKVSRRFVAEMVFGIQARGSVRLTEVGRALGERITFKKTEETNLPVRRSRKSIWHVVQSYITRRRIEDVIRFVKQSYRLEDMRCLTYHRLQALMVLVTAAAYFAAVYLGLRMKLRVLAGHVLRASKHVFGIPDFRLYALADGIRQFLYSQTQGLKKFLELENQPPIQPKLFYP